MDIQTARAEYLENYYNPIPLLEKIPVSRRWQEKSTAAQWYHAPDKVNIGLRAGDGKAFLDLDDKNQEGTTDRAMRFFAGLGYLAGDYPMVRTPSGGSHIYINFTGNLIDSKRNLNTEIGAGQLCYGRGAYVVAWPSVIERGPYTMVSGDIARLPVLDMQDIRKLININAVPAAPKIQKKMSRLAVAIANGTKPDKYSSNSEGEAGLVLSLINSGYTYGEIKHIFESMPCLGHYNQKHAGKDSREGERWLYMTYQNALTYSQTESPARRMIAKFIEQAESAAWRNANRKRVFISHLQIAQKPGRKDYAASLRDIALRAGVRLSAASNQTRKLITDELLSVKEPGSVRSATVYILNVANVEHFLKDAGTRATLPDVETHDAFRNGGGRYAKGRLGRRAGEIYALLLTQPLTIPEIAKKIGTCKRTVKRQINKLRKVVDYQTGEIIEMVSMDGGAWYANEVSLDQIAALKRTYGATGKQRLDYEKERREHNRSLEIGAAKLKPHKSIA